MPQDDKTKHAFEMIEQGVKDVYTSDNFKRYLSCLSKFHKYSLNNTLLILAQNPNASLVAGYNSWANNFNRHVNKGEKGLMILAPITEKIKKLADKLDENGNPVLNEDGESIKEEKEFNITRFNTTTVFDIAQTTGDPIPSYIEELRGTSDAAVAFIETIKEESEIPIEFKSMEDDENLKRGAKGYYSPIDDKIVINDEMGDIQKAKTLAHEYSHSLWHKKTDKDKDQKEIEAEANAFVICNHFGIDTSDYSFGYIASYTNQDLEALKDILNQIQSSSHEIIEKLEPTYKNKVLSKTLGNKYLTPIETFDLCKDVLADVVEGITLDKNDPTVDNQMINDFIDKALFNTLSSNPNYQTQYDLYNNNKTFYRKLRRACYRSFMNPKLSYADLFINSSLERGNYELFESFAAPLLSEQATYIKFTSKGYMDVNVEIIDDDRYAIAHNYVMNGDLMADPDVEFIVDKKNKLLYPQSYQQDNLNYYMTVDGGLWKANELNLFMEQWFNNIQQQGYRAEVIHTEEDRLDAKENIDEVKKFCKDNNIPKMAPKNKEIER